MCTFVLSERIVYLFFMRGQQNVHTRHHSKFTEDANKNKQKWRYCQSKNFSGTSDTITQPAITCSKLTIETLEQGVKYVQS